MNYPWSGIYFDGTPVKMIAIADIESNKFTDKFKFDFDHSSLKEFKKVKLHIDKDYFYFTGYYETTKDQIQFQSLNFDARFIETLENKYQNGMVE